MPAHRSVGGPETRTPSSFVTGCGPPAGGNLSAVGAPSGAGGDAGLLVYLPMTGVTQVTQGRDVWCVVP